MANIIPLYNQWTYDWLITPFTPSVLERGETPPKTILDQKWLLFMSGVVSGDQDPALGDWAVLKGTSNAQWNPQTVTFIPGGSTGAFYSLDNGTGTGPLYDAYAKYFYSVPPPPPPYFPLDATGGQPGTRIAFSVERLVSFVGLNGVFDQAESINAGYAVKEWRPHHYLKGPSVYSGGSYVGNIFAGIDVDIGVRDNDAWILKLGFNITLLGKIVFVDSGGVELM
jgi:hypothetical protein